MKQVDIVVENGTILTMDENNTIFEEGIVCIKGDTISYIGTRGKEGFEAKKKQIVESVSL